MNVFNSFTPTNQAIDVFRSFTPEQFNEADELIAQQFRVHRLYPGMGIEWPATRKAFTECWVRAHGHELPRQDDLFAQWDALCQHAHDTYWNDELVNQPDRWRIIRDVARVQIKTPEVEVETTEKFTCMQIDEPVCHGAPGEQIDEPVFSVGVRGKRPKKPHVVFDATRGIALTRLSDYIRWTKTHRTHVPPGFVACRKAVLAVLCLPCQHTAEGARLYINEWVPNAHLQAEEDIASNDPASRRTVEKMIDHVIQEDRVARDIEKRRGMRLRRREVTLLDGEDETLKRRDVSPASSDTGDDEPAGGGRVDLGGMSKRARVA